MDEEIYLEGFHGSFVNAGRGKGLAVYYKKDQSIVVRDINEEDLQISVLTSANTTIIGLYRSKTNTSLALQEILEVAHDDCVIMGDFNICSNSNPQDPVIQTLKNHGFREMVNRPTHILGGFIDMIWTRVANRLSEAQIYSPYYTCKDHDCLLLSIYSSAPMNSGERLNSITIKTSSC